MGQFPYLFRERERERERKKEGEPEIKSVKLEHTIKNNKEK
jgi:hypothetical protein